MSFQTAPVGLVMTAIVAGRAGSGRLRAVSNSPSAASRALSASNRRVRSPRPAGWIDSTYSWSAPCGSNRSIRPCATTRSPACASNAERIRWSRNQTHWSWLRSSFSAK